MVQKKTRNRENENMFIFVLVAVKVTVWENKNVLYVQQLTLQMILFVFVMYRVILECDMMIQTQNNDEERYACVFSLPSNHIFLWRSDFTFHPLSQTFSSSFSSPLFWFPHNLYFSFQPVDFPDRIQSLLNSVFALISAIK